MLNEPYKHIEDSINIMKISRNMGMSLRSYYIIVIFIRIELQVIWDNVSYFVSKSLLDIFKYTDILKSLLIMKYFSFYFAQSLPITHYITDGTSDSIHQFPLESSQKCVRFLFILKFLSGDCLPSLFPYKLL